MTATVSHGEMLSLLIEQYKLDPRLRAYLGAHLTQSQEIEDSAQDVAASRDVDQATGAALDLLGAIVGIGRLGQTDEVYRILIKGRILVNLSNGRGNELITLLTATVTGGGSYTFEEVFPASVYVRISGIPDQQAKAVSLLVRSLIGAGIGESVGLNPDPTTAFFFNTTTGSVNTAPGYNTTTGSVTDGGEWTRNI